MPITKYIALYNNKKKWAAFRLDFSGSFKPALSKVCTRVCTPLWVYILLSFNRGFNCRNFCSSQLRQFTIWIHICSLFKEKRGDFKSLEQTKNKLNSFPYKLQVSLTNEIIVESLASLDIIYECNIAFAVVVYFLFGYICYIHTAGGTK